MKKFEDVVGINRKKVIFLGSSVTYGFASEGVSFADFICEKNGLEMVKEAVSGTTLVDKDNLSYVSRLKALEESECDLFVCQLSTNDASQKLPINEVEAAIDYIIDYVKKKWNCPIAFYTNPRYDSVEYAAMVERIQEKAEKEGFLLMDMWNDEKLNNKISENRDYYMADTIHPTLAGYREIITPFMEEFGIF